MQFTHQSMTFDVGINIDHNLIAATYIDPKNISEFNDENTGRQIKKMKYADIFSVSLNISDIFLNKEDYTDPYDSCYNKYWNTIVKKLCEQIDIRME